MSKNKNHRNFSYNNYNNMNMGNKNNVVEDIQSSEIKLDEVSSVNNIMPEVIDTMEFIEETPVEISVDEVQKINETVETIEEEPQYENIIEVTDIPVVIDDNVVGHNDPVGEPGESGIISNDDVYVDTVAITITEFKYEIAIDLINGKKVGYKAGTNDLDSACNIANEETKNTGIVHHVYNDQGFVVFSSKKKLTLLTNKKRGNKNVNWYS